MSIREFTEMEKNAVDQFGELLSNEAPNLTKAGAVAMAKIMANTKGKDLTSNIKSDTLRERVIDSLKGRVTDSVNPNNVTTNVEGYDEPLLTVLAQSAHKMLALDVVGIQPMPHARHNLHVLKRWYDKPSSGFPFQPQDVTVPVKQGSGNQATATPPRVDPANPADYVPHAPTLETDVVNQMSVSVEAMGVEAVERKIKSVLSREFAEDLKAYHGLDGRSLLSTLLSDEIALTTDRQILSELYKASTPFDGGTYDLVASGDGRWLEERTKALAYHIFRMSNAIADATFKGLGNVAIVSFGVAQALNLSGLLSGVTGEVDWLRSTYVGMLGHIQVFVDPYLERDAVVMTYKQSDIEAGMFYMPYVALELYDGMQEDSGNDVLFARSRYATALNPLGTNNGANPTSTYVLRCEVTNL